MKNWCYKKGKEEKEEKKKKELPPIPVIKTKTTTPLAVTPFRAYCKSGSAPPGKDHLEPDGRRCGLAILNAARKAAWNLLSYEEQESYREVAAQRTRDLKAAAGDDAESDGDVEMEVA